MKLFGIALALGLLMTGTAAAADDMPVKINAKTPSVTVQTKDGPVEIKRNQDTDATIAPAYAKTSRKCPPFCIQPMQVAPGVTTVGEIELLEFAKAGGKLIDGIFEGATINTPSMLCVEDYIDALKWAEEIGGLDALHARAARNAAALGAWVEATDWIDFLCADPEIRSNTSVCLKIVDPSVTALGENEQRAFVKAMEKALDAEGAAYDIGGYRDAPPGLRIWCGATVDSADIKALGPWLDWAFAEAKSAI